MTTMLLSLLLSLAVIQGAQQPPSVKDSARAGEIRGRITDQETGQPLARATVRLRRVGEAESLATRTDHTGLYRFVGLAAGQYSGFVDAGRFRATHLMRPLGTVAGPYRPIVLKDGEVREVNVALSRAHAITVRVVDAWGDPLSGLRVTVRPIDSGSIGSASLQRATDDQGRLRVFGLSSGRYVVCVEGDPLGASAAPGSRRQSERLLRTCYPSATDEAQAQLVRVDREDVGELEITMRRGRTFTISGRVLDASGMPATGALVSLSQFRTNGSSSKGIKVDADGQFSVTNVHPGDYAIEASLGGPDRPEQRRGVEAGFLPIRVEDSDIEALTVLMHKGVDVAGRITPEDLTTQLPEPPGSGLMIRMRLADDRLPGSGSTRSELVRADRVFTLTGIFGRRTLELVNVPRGWYVKSIRYRGKEIIDEPTEFTESSDPSALEMILSTRGASVIGRVVDDRGDPVGGAMVFMFRADASQSAAPLSRSAVASTTGTFRIGPARAGDYLIVAVPASAPMLRLGEWDRVARLAAAAERITLAELDERTIDLRVVPDR